MKIIGYILVFLSAFSMNLGLPVMYALIFFGIPGFLVWIIGDKFNKS